MLKVHTLTGFPTRGRRVALFRFTVRGILERDAPMAESQGNVKRQCVAQGCVYPLELLDLANKNTVRFELQMNE